MKNKGQTLVEVLISIALASVVLSSLAVIVLASIKNATVGNSQTVADSYAQQGLETMRNMRNTNYSNSSGTGFSQLSSPAYCMSGSSSCNSGVSTTAGDHDCGPAASTMAATSGCNAVDTNGKYLRMISIQRPGVCPTLPAGATGILTQVTATVYWTDNKCSSVYCHFVQQSTCLSDVIPGN